MPMRVSYKREGVIRAGVGIASPFHARCKPQQEACFATRLRAKEVQFIVRAALAHPEIRMLGDLVPGAHSFKEGEIRIVYFARECIAG